MKGRNRNPLWTGTWMGLALLGTACSPSKDERLARMAQEATQRQAEQNQELVRLNRDVAESHQRLVEAEGNARREILQVQRDLVQRDAQSRQELGQLQRETQAGIRQERAGLDRQHEELEEERREMALQRGRDPIIAAALTGLGVVLACLAPLLAAVYLLRAVRSEGPADAELAELLTQELVAQRPALLPAPHAGRPGLEGFPGDQRLLGVKKGEPGQEDR